MKMNSQVVIFENGHGGDKRLNELIRNGKIVKKMEKNSSRTSIIVNE